MSYNVAKEGVGLGSLAVSFEDQGDDGFRISNGSGRVELPDGVIELRDDLSSLEYLRSSSVTLNPDATWVSRIGEADLTAAYVFGEVRVLDGRDIDAYGAEVVAKLEQAGYVEPSIVFTSSPTP